MNAPSQPNAPSVSFRLSDVPSPNRVERIVQLLFLVLTACLPVKFGTISGVPEIPASYWGDFWSLIFAGWPLHVFSLTSALLLALTCLGRFRRGTTLPLDAISLFGGLWIFLALTSILGFWNSSCPEYAFQMCAHAFGVSCYAGTLVILIQTDPDFPNRLFWALGLGATLSMASGLNQYFVGFDNLESFMQAQNYNAGTDVISGQFKSRMLERRLMADFSVCNTYGGYLAMVGPLLLWLIWDFGRRRVSPERISCWILFAPACAVLGFLIWQTGSRGAVFSLTAALTVFLLSFRMSWKMRTGAIAGILFLFGIFLWMVLAGRGFKSMIFRFDYDWAAFRMMLDHPFAGTGWGDFFHDYLQLKLLVNTEAPHSPHNFPLLFGSQCGMDAFFAALGLLILPVFCAMRKFHREPLPRFDGNALASRVLYFCFLVGLFDSLLEISYETPGFIATMAAIGALLLNMTRPERPNGRMAHPRIARLFRIGLLTIAVGTLCFSVWMIRAESAFAELFEALDPRFSRPNADGSPAKPPAPAKVLHLIEQATRKAPCSPFPRMTAAQYCWLRGDLASAEEFVTDAIRLSPNRSSFYLQRAVFRYMKAGRTITTEVEDDLRHVRRLSPNNPEFLPDVSDSEILRSAHPNLFESSAP